MTKYLFSLIFILVSSFTFSQHKEQSSAIAFEEVEQPPLYKRCKEKWDFERQRNCTSSAVNNFVNTRFDMDRASKLDVREVYMKAEFIVTEEGNVEEITVTGGPEELNQHLYQILRSLKKFTPGKQNGSPVAVSFELPVSMRFF